MADGLTVYQRLMKKGATMREILFRGKRIDNGEWVEGGLVIWSDGSTSIFDQHIDVPTWSVDPDTVGQYTELKDKYGKQIFEGDIVKGRDYDERTGYGVVEWYDGAFQIANERWCGTFNELYYSFEFEIIGNIHDNPTIINNKDE